MFKGSIPALVTPMHPDGTLDKKALERLVAWYIESGVTAVVAVGTTGESATLNVKEHCQVIEWVVGCVAGQIPVIAGTGANATDEAIELTKTAKSLGADACLSVTPYYNKPTQKGLVAHYQAIAAAVDLPILLYNVPGRTVCDLLPETVITLADVDNIIGIKDATADVERVKTIQTAVGSEFILLSGDDATAKDFILQGGHGVISVTANVVPMQMQAMCMAALKGEAVEAAAIDDTISDLHSQLFIESSPIPVKWALFEMGYIEKGIRLPLTWFDEKYHDTLRTTLKQVGCLG